MEKEKSEYKEEMIHKFQTVRLSFLEFQSLVYNELNNTQSLSRVDSSVHLIYHDPSDLGLISDPDPDHFKGTHP